MTDIDNCHMTCYPSSVLRHPAEPVEKIDERIRMLVEKMIDIMVEHKGIGLAAPQAGVGLQLFIVSLKGTRQDVKVFINPTVTSTGHLVAMEEGCLSVPGINAKIQRYDKCKVTATDLDGSEFTEEAEGLYARCLQHEYDHINGITIADKMGSVAKIGHRRQLKKLEQYRENNAKG